MSLFKTFLEGKSLSKNISFGSQVLATPLNKRIYRLERLKANWLL